MFDSIKTWMANQIIEHVRKGAFDSDQGWITLLEGNQPQTKLGNMSRQLAAYQNQVYKCVTIIMRRIQSLDWHLIYRKGWEEADVDQHVFYDLAKKPNPIWTFTELMSFLCLHLDLTGRAFWRILPGVAGRPGEIWPLSPANFKEIMFAPGETVIAGYKFFRYDRNTKEAKPVIYPAEEIVDFRYPHPVYPLEGCSPIQQMAYSYDTDLAMRVFQRNFFQNDARPNITFETDKDISDTAADRFLHRINSTYKGVDKRWRPLILGSGLKTNVISQSVKDLELAGLMGFTKEDILEAYNVPAGKLGTIKDVNRANQDAIDLAFNSECIRPRLDLISEVISVRLLSRYDRNLYFAFENPVPSDREYLLKERESNLKSGYKTINEERADDGLDPVPWGDEPWFPINLYQPSGGVMTGADDTAKAVTKSVKPNLQAGAIRLKAKWEKAMLRATKKWFAELKKEVNQNIEEKYPQYLEDLKSMGFTEREAWIEKKDIAETIVFDMENAQALIDKHIVPVIMEALKEGGEAALAYLDIEIVLDMREFHILECLATRKNLLSNIADDLFNTIRDEIREGIILGEGVNALQQRLIENVWDETEQVRALRVARTESAVAVNRGTLEGYRQSDVVERKEWLSAPDARETHQAAGAQYQGSGAIPIDQDFHVGAGHGPCPGSIGLPEEDINCRCFLSPVVSD